LAVSFFSILILCLLGWYYRRQDNRKSASGA